MPRADRLQGEGAAVELVAAELAAVGSRGRRTGSGRGPGGQVGVDGEDATRSGHQQGQPGEEEDDVGAGVVGTGVEADGQEEAERQGHAADGGDAGPEAEKGAESDGEFPEGHDHTEGNGHVLERADEGVDGTVARRLLQLGLDRGQVVGVEESGVGQLLQAGEGEGGADEGAQGQEGPTSRGDGHGRRRSRAVAPDWWSFRSLRGRRTAPVASSEVGPSPAVYRWVLARGWAAGGARRQGNGGHYACRGHAHRAFEPLARDRGRGTSARHR